MKKAEQEKIVASAMKNRLLNSDGASNNTATDREEATATSPTSTIFHQNGQLPLPSQYWNAGPSSWRPPNPMHPMPPMHPMHPNPPYARHFQQSNTSEIKKRRLI